jgi:hypothetical protein
MITELLPIFKLCIKDFFYLRAQWPKKVEKPWKGKPHAVVIACHQRTGLEESLTNTRVPTRR